MGTIKRGILGGFSGAVASVVGTSWKGIAVIKSKPLSVANPNTTAQSDNRTAFKACALAGSAILTGFIKPIWDRLASKQSGYNFFVQQNKQAFSTAGVLDVTKLIASMGKYESLAIDSSVATAASDECVVSWTDDSGSDYKLATDKAYVIVFNETQEVWGVASGTRIRENPSVTVLMPTNFVQADDYSTWLVFRSADGLRIFKGSSELSNTVQ